MKKTGKRILALLLCVLLTLALLPIEARAYDTSGDFGDGLHWALNDAGTLTISGSGPMPDWDEDDPPWSIFTNTSYVKKVVVAQGVTHVGSYSFDHFELALTTVELADSVTSIGESAFRGCYVLTNLTLGSGVTTIGEDAFYMCKALTAVTFPDSVTEIGYRAFAECYGLSQVTFGKNLVTIGDTAFASTALTEVKIPDSVTSIGIAAFSHCSNLQSVTIGRGVTKIGRFAFNWCSNLSEVHISDLAAWCRIEFGDYPDSPENISSNPLYYAHLLYLNGEPLLYPVIPSGVTKISDYAFYNAYIFDVTIPASVKEIGKEAFYGCDGIGRAVINGGVTKIGAGAFSGCENMVILVLPSTLSTVGNGAFMDCWGLSDVYYAGTQQQWNNIDFGEDNKCIENLGIHYQSLLILEQPESVTVPVGQKAKTWVTAGGEEVSYQWYIKNPGSTKFSKSSVTGPAYSVNMTESVSGRQIYCVVTDKNGNSLTTNIVTLSAAPALVITAQPKNAAAAVGDRATVSVTATGEGLSYQWYIKNPGKTKFSKSSVTTASYSVPMTAAISGRQLYCIVTDAYGQTAKTNTVTLTAKNTALSIVTQPKNASAAVGEKAKATVTAAGDGLSYQWYIKNKGASKFSKSSVTSPTYSVTMSDTVNGRQIYCVVKDQYGDTVQSNTVTLSIKGTPLAITTQPKSTTVADGKKATVTVAAAGDGLTYQWYIKNRTSAKYSKSSVTTASYSVTMSDTVNGRLLYCIVTDKYGNTEKSNTVRLYSTTLAIVQQPKNASAAVGERVTVKVVASGQGLTYQWYIKNPGKTKFSKSSVTEASYSVTMTEAISGRQLYCVVTDKNGNTVTSSTVTISKS